MSARARRGFPRLVLPLALALAACAGAADARDGGADPFERANRAVLEFNLKVDRYALKPVAKAYAKLPQPVRNGVGNFFANWWTPNTVLNDLLQGKFAHAGRDAGRFAINTTLGLLGVMEVAGEIGLPARSEDFGQTLAVWGAPAGPYLVLPLLGPSNLRDAVALAPQSYADPLAALESPQSSYARGLRLVDRRARLLGADDALALQVDQYLFLREGYRQQRNAAIHDGDPPNDLGDDALCDELLQE
ncbi:MAG: MlaA family lipoprotein [bacterium]